MPFFDRSLVTSWSAPLFAGHSGEKGDNEGSGSAVTIGAPVDMQQPDGRTFNKRSSKENEASTLVQVPLEHVWTELNLCRK